MLPDEPDRNAARIPDCSAREALLLSFESGLPRLMDLEWLIDRIARQDQGGAS